MASPRWEERVQARTKGEKTHTLKLVSSLRFCSKSEKPRVHAFQSDGKLFTQTGRFIWEEKDIQANAKHLWENKRQEVPGARSYVYKEPPIKGEKCRLFTSKRNISYVGEGRIWSFLSALYSLCGRESQGTSRLRYYYSITRKAASTFPLFWSVKGWHVSFELLLMHVRGSWSTCCRHPLLESKVFGVLFWVVYTPSSFFSNSQCMWPVELYTSSL